MLQDYCDVTIVLDRSGSMASIWSESVSGLDAFVAEQKKTPGKCNLTLRVFDDRHDVALDAVPVASVGPMAIVLADFGPRSMTALHDAIGLACKATGDRLAAMPEAERPGRVIVVIVTDGGENSSREFRGRIAPIVKEQRETYAWEFLFLGANQDAVVVGGSLGVPASNAMTYAANGVGTRSAFASTSESVATARVKGVAASYTEADREAQKLAGIR